MRPRIRWLALVAGVAVTALGCAASGPARPTAAFNVPCLPAEVPPGFFAWPVIGFRPLVLRTDDGDSVPAFWVLYRRGEVAVAAIWTVTDLVTIDPSPGTNEPEWVDGALVNDAGAALVILAKPRPPCQWRRHKQPGGRV
jgi:hypothetical protein